MNRRMFFQSGMAAGASVMPAGGVSLREKFFGCICGVFIGSSMAAPVEGWTWQRIEKEYGTVDRLMSYVHYRNGWKREPGTTEDGAERQKLMITTIIEKEDRVNAEDVRRIWVRDIKPESAGMVSEPFEAILLAMAKTGIPAIDIGRYCDYAGLVSMARSCHPIGLINAGDIQGAIADVFEVGQLYQTSNSRGLRWAAVTAAALAAATKAGATVDSVIGAIFDSCDRDVVREIERGLKLTDGAQDFKEMRARFDNIYYAIGLPYAQAYANEVVTKGISIFRYAKGNLKDAIIAGVNFGRDTDCATAVGAGITGALGGAASLPKEWVEQVDKATKLNRYTNSQRTVRENSDGLFQAFRARLRKMKSYAETMETA